MANMSFGVNILPKTNTETLGNSEHPWILVNPQITGNTLTNGDIVSTGTIETTSPRFRVKNIDVNVQEDDNGVTVNSERFFAFVDSNTTSYALVDGLARPNGTVGLFLGVRAYDGETDTGWSGITINKAKDSTVSYVVSSPEAFRTAIGAVAKINAPSSGTFWRSGRDAAILKITTYANYNPILSQKTTSGSWQMGVYSNNELFFSYTTDDNYTNGNNLYSNYGLKPHSNSTIAYTKYLTDAFYDVSKSGKTFTLTRLDGTTTTINQLNRPVALNSTVKLADTAETTLDLVPGNNISITYASGGKFTFDTNNSVTLSGTLSLTNTTDTSGTAANAVALKIGSATGNHLEFDPNEIMAKTSGTAVGDLNLNYDGGNVVIGTTNTSYYVNIRSTKSSTSTSTGALIVGGGAGFGGAVYAASFNRVVASASAIHPFTVENTSDTVPHKISIHSSAAGNQGLYDVTNAKWIIYSTPAGAIKLGTVTGGTWNGTAIDIAYGGTGQTATSNTTTIADIATATSGNTITTANYSQWGKIAMLYLTVTVGTAVTSNTTLTTLATLNTGKRPKYYAPLLRHNSTYMGRITSAGSITTYGSITANASITIYSVYLLA